VHWGNFGRFRKIGNATKAAASERWWSEEASAGSHPEQKGAQHEDAVKESHAGNLGSRAPAGQLRRSSGPQRVTPRWELAMNSIKCASSGVGAELLDFKASKAVAKLPSFFKNNFL
jgi:hypothetical protein